MKVAIIGFARDGKVSYDYFTKAGHDVTICDQNTSLELPQAAKAKLGDGYLDNLGEFDLIMRSSGIAPQKILDKNPGVESKISSAVDEFLRACPTKNTIGVTGTKGKGTTCTLIVKMLEADGKKVFFGGNVGWSPLEFIDQITPDDWVVLELSSFQLCDIKHSTQIGVCLMVVPEHLDWHSDLDEYFLAKSRLFELQKPGNIAIYYSNNSESKEIAGSGPAIKIPYYHDPGAYVDQSNHTLVIAGQTICNVRDIKLLGQFNWQNICAAATVIWQITQNVEAIRQVATSFTGLEHHLELAAEKDGVGYYDDSFGTIPETAIVAMQAFAQPEVLILGGSSKNSNYKELARKISEAKNIRKVVLIGNSTHASYKSATPDIEEAFRAVGFTNYVSLFKPGGPTMTEVVSTAQSVAQSGDIVLLSTGCASFDMFVDYKDRGNQFKQAARELA